MSTVIVEACGYFRPTLKPSYCKCGWHVKFHAHTEWQAPRWGWRARHLAQPDSEECE